MKKAYRNLIPVALAMVLAGCGNETNEPDLNGGKSSPDFTATISDGQSRAFNQTWNEGDEIGITGSGSSNVCYVTAEADGTFTAKNVGEQIYFRDNNTTTFTAYYPWTNLADGATTISADTKNQAQQSQFDFLWTQATGSKESPKVNLAFAHKMAKVVLTVRPGTGMTFDEVKAAALSLEGFSHNGTFNVTDGTTTFGAVSDAWSISDLAVENTEEKLLTFTLIFFPQTFTDPLQFKANLSLPDDKNLLLSANIDFTSANREKEGSAAKNEWVSGRQYNLSLTLNKTEIKVNECVINPWNVVGGDDIVVD